MARKQDRAAQPQTHSRATTTPRVRRAIQLSEEKNIALAKRYGVSRKTIAKWKARRVYVRRANGPDKSPRERSHAGRRSDHSRLPLSLFGVDRSRASLRRLDPGQPVLNRGSDRYLARNRQCAANEIKSTLSGRSHRALRSVGLAKDARMAENDAFAGAVVEPRKNVPLLVEAGIDEKFACRVHDPACLISSLDNSALKRARSSPNKEQ